MDKGLMTWRGVGIQVAYERNKYWQLSAGGAGTTHVSCPLMAGSAGSLLSFRL